MASGFKRQEYFSACYDEKVRRKMAASRWGLLGLVFYCGLLFGNTTQSVRTIEPFQRQVPWSVEFNNQTEAILPLESQLGFIFLNVMINGQGPYRFLLDTGADTSIISYELVKKLQLPAIESKKKVFHTAHKKTEIDTFLYIIPTLKIGDLTLKGAPFVASNTASDDFQLLQDLNIIGILGMNLLHDLIVTLDLPYKQLILAMQPEVPVNEQKIAKYHSDYFLPVINTRVIKNGQSDHYYFLIDSGYTGFAKMPICFKNKLHGSQAEIMTFDVFNQSEEGFLAELDGEWIVGDTKLENPMVKYVMGNCEHPPKWGLIGTRFLQFHKVTIDQRHRQVIVH